MQGEPEPDLVSSRCNLTLGPCVVATASQHAIFWRRVGRFQVEIVGVAI